MSDRSAPQIPGLSLLGEEERTATSVVYRGLRGDFTVAVKLPTTADPSQLAVFRRTAGLQACLSEPCLPQTFELGTHLGRPYIVREWALGRSLVQQVARGCLDAAAALRLAQCLAGALASLHRQHLCHGAVTPHNVHYLEGDAIKLVDDAAAGRDLALACRAPELRGETPAPPSPPADVYALGAVLVYALTGQLSATTVMTGVPAPFAELLPRLLAHEPTDRPSAAEVRDFIAPTSKLRTTRDDPPVRDDLLRQLTQAWHQARRLADRSGRHAVPTAPLVVMLEGPAGCGKSHLLREFLARQDAATTPLVITTSAPAEYHPLAAVAQALQALALQVHADPQIASVVGPALRGQAKLFAPLAPALAALAPADTTSTDADTDDDLPPLTREQLGGAVLDLLAHIANHFAVIWAVDDLAAVDVDSMHILRRFAARPLTGAALLVACRQTVGTADPPPRLRLQFPALTVATLTPVIAQALGSRRFDPELVEILHNHSEGNPRAALGLLRRCLAAGALYPCWDTWVGDLDELQTLVTTRDEPRPQGPTMLAVLRLVALAGLPLTVSTLAAASGYTPQIVHNALAAAFADGFMVCTKIGYALRDAALRRALIADLTPAALQAAHQCLAEQPAISLQPHAYARHLLAGSHADVDRLRDAGLAAGLAALALAADEQAYRVLHATAAVPKLTPSPELQTALAEACLRTGRLQQADALLAAGAKQPTQVLPRAQQMRRRARVALLRREHERALQTLGEALTATGGHLPKTGPGAVWASVWACIQLLWLAATRLGLASLHGPARLQARLQARCLEDAAIVAYLALERPTMTQAMLRHFALALRIGPSAELALAHANFSLLLLSSGLRRQGLVYAQKSLRLGNKLGPAAVARVHQRLMLAYEFAGEPLLCAQLGTQVLGPERRWLDAWAQMTAGEVLAFSLWLRGRASAALATVTPLLAEYTQWTDDPAGAHALVSLRVIAGLSWASLGRLDEADQAFAAARAALAHGPRDPFQTAVLATAEVLYCFERGELGAPLERAISHREQLDLGRGRPPYYARFFAPFVALARLEQAIAATPYDRPAALARLDAAIANAATTRPHPLHAGLWELARAGAAWLRGDTEAALVALRRADDVAIKTDNNRVRFAVLRLQAQVLQSTGHLDAAAREARLALTLAEAEDWTGKAAALRRELGLGGGDFSSADLQARKLRRQLDALLALSLAASRARGFAEQAQAALAELCLLLPAERAALFLGNDSQPLVLAAGRDSHGQVLTGNLDLDLTTLDQVRQRRTPYLARGDREHPSILAAPLLLRDDLIGIVYLDSHTVCGAFTGDDVDILQTIAGHLAIALETAKTTQLEAQIVAAEHEKSALIEHATSAVGIGIAVLQPDGVLAQVSPTLRAMTQRWPTVAAWWEATTRQLLLPETSACPQCGEPQILGRSVADLHHGETRQVFEITFTGHFHEFTREEAGHVLLVSDITPRQISEEKLLRLNEDLTQARDAALAASRAKSTFLANMSHELRTPLNAIIGFAEMLVEDAEQVGARHMVTDLGKIRMSGTHLLELISTILDLSKVETGRMELEILEFSLVALVQRVASMLTPMVAKNRNMLSHSVAPDVDRIIGDETKVQQILFNLLSNAAKFTQDGVVKLEATALHEDGRDWVICTVTDTGIGFRTDQIDKLFQDFYQADMSTTRKYGGTGLGLAIVDRFCRLMDGEVSVTSEPDIGSCFRVKLPRVLQRPPTPTQTP